MKNSFIIFVVLFGLSCSKTDTSFDKRINQSGGTKITYDFSKQPKQIVYEDMFESVDGVVGIKNKTVVNNLGAVEDNLFVTNFMNNGSSPPTAVNGGSVIINCSNTSMTLEFDNNSGGGQQYLATNMDDEATFFTISTFFDNEIEIIVNGDDGDFVPAMSLTLPTPEKLEITAPDLASITPDPEEVGADGLPQVSISQSLTLGWNLQENNDNGVAIVIWWSGLMFDSGQINNTSGSSQYVFLTDDDGSHQLPFEVFQEIGENALIEISILRGNVEILDISGQKYKFYALTEAATTPILLVE